MSQTCQKETFLGIAAAWLGDQFTRSMSLSFRILSNQGCSGPYRRKIVNQLLPGTV